LNPLMRLRYFLKKAVSIPKRVLEALNPPILIGFPWKSQLFQSLKGF